MGDCVEERIKRKKKLEGKLCCLHNINGRTHIYQLRQVIRRKEINLSLFLMMYIHCSTGCSNNKKSTK